MITWPPSASDVISARRILAALQKEGMHQIVRYAFLAQADYESAFNPNAKGDYLDANGKVLPWSAHPSGTPSAFGLWQRQKARLDKYMNASGVDIYSAVMANTNAIEQDSACLWWELQNIPAYGYAAIAAAKTSRDAAIIACEKFEIATTSASDRGQRAEMWIKALA